MSDALLDKELCLFEKEYAHHYLEGESKPPSIGMPYLLHHADHRVGILLVHGLMAAPEEVREWADFLFAQGYNVYAPRMAGHGTSAVDLASRDAQAWEASVQRGYAILQSCSDQVVAAGFSTGAAVVLKQVITQPDAFSALISISAPLTFTKFSANFAKPLTILNRVLKQVGLGALAKEFVTNHADNPHINYLRCPVCSIAEIQKLMGEVKTGLPSVRIPALVIHADKDPKVDAASGREIYRLLGSPDKRYREIAYHLHGIVRGEIGRQVFTEVADFLNEVVPV